LTLVFFFQGELRGAHWARQADELSMFPSTHMIRLVDKKFGGELVKSDILGVEVEEYDSDEVDGATMALGGGEGAGDMASEYAGSQVRSKVRSGAGKSVARTRRTNKSKRAARRRPKLLPIDCSNDAYLLMKEEARAHRLAINWLEVNANSLGPIAEAAAELREEWSAWNPQREAAKRLDEDVRAGRITLEVRVSLHEIFIIV
jgi:hypothetical protein